MSKELWDRAEKLRAKFKDWETRKRGSERDEGFGHHPDDTDPSEHVQRQHPHMRRKVAPSQNGMPPWSENLVLFYDHDDREEAHFVGADAEKAMATLKEWLGKVKMATLASAPGSARALVLRILPKLKLETVDGLPRLTVRLCDLNDVLAGLAERGVFTSGAPLVHDGDPKTP